MPEARRRPLTLFAGTVAVVAFGLAACTSGGGTAQPTTATSTTGGPAGTEPEDANSISIEMTEYGFAVSGTLAAGTSTVAMRNTGQELHMAAFGLLREGKTLADAQAAYQSGDERAPDAVFASPVGEAPGALLSPGQAQTVSTEALGPGTYAVLCFLPTAGEEGTHLAKGMAATIVVAPGAVARPAPPSDADYVVGDGRIEGPAALAAGTRTLRFTSAGVGPHEFFVVRKRSAATTYAEVDDYFARLFGGDTPPPPGYAEQAPAVFTAGAFDLAAGRATSLTTRLEPGSYLVGCALEDDRARPGTGTQHTGEVLEVTVTAAATGTGSP